MLALVGSAAIPRFRRVSSHASRSASVAKRQQHSPRSALIHPIQGKLRCVAAPPCLPPGLGFRYSAGAITPLVVSEGRQGPANIIPKRLIGIHPDENRYCSG